MVGVPVFVGVTVPVTFIVGVSVFVGVGVDVAFPVQVILSKYRPYPYG
jgi:hypothetical protein